MMKGLVYSSQTQSRDKFPDLLLTELVIVLIFIIDIKYHPTKRIKILTKHILIKVFTIHT